MSWDEEKNEENETLIPLNPELNDKNEKYIPLMYVFSRGEGINIDQNSVLVRPLLRVIKEGKPIGTINYTFYEENGKRFILGSFAFSGKRIIFFLH